MPTEPKSDELRGIWHRWKRSDRAPQRIGEFSRERFGARISSIVVNDLEINNRKIPATRVVIDGVEAIYPHLLPEEWPDRTGSARCLRRERTDIWLLPGFEPVPELMKWTTAFGDDEDERRTRTLEGMLIHLYDDRRLARFICHCRNVTPMDSYMPLIVEAIECYWLGRFRGGVGVLYPVVEALLRDVCALTGAPVEGSRERAIAAIDRSFGKIVRVRLGLNRRSAWVPDEYLSIETQARVDYLALILLQLRNYLAEHFFAKLTPADAERPHVLNRHAFAHLLSLQPVRRVAVLKLVCIVETITKIFGYMLNYETIFFYGTAHGGHSTGGRIIEPENPVAALLQHRTALTTVDAMSGRTRNAVIGELTLIKERRDSHINEARRRSPMSETLE